MSRKIRPISFILSILLVSGMSAEAQERQPKIALTISAEREVEVAKDGEETIQRIAADETKSGDVLVYTVVYTNEGDAPAGDAVIVDPIPDGTTYVVGSATGKDALITYSIDGGKFFQAPPVEYVIRRPDGTKERKTAPAEMYTHIRWLIQKRVLPGESGRLGFRVIVE